MFWIISIITTSKPLAKPHSFMLSRVFFLYGKIMTISAKVIEDSISQAGKRITTLQLKMPKFILAELNTHRVFSRSTASSRAIPTTKLIEMVRENPVMPVHWGKNQAGMQANNQITDNDLIECMGEWRLAANNAADSAEYMLAHGLHKQVVNRVLEPFLYVDTIVTATEWDNFFELRDHPDAQPEMQELARCMRRAIDESAPNFLAQGAWHLPYVTGIERIPTGKLPKEELNIKLAKLSAARCARVSYLKHDGTIANYEEDLKLFDRLIMSKPAHASPVEHQAIPLSDANEQSRNFRGWKQFRDVLGV